jgi:LuxR family maltose regulon positive regulatory protein
LLPDGIIFPLAAYSWLLGEIVDEMIEQKYPQYIERFKTVKERFSIGWSTLHEAVCLGELPADLTPREYEVAMLAAEGLRNGEIAQKLTVTESTVRAHLRVIFQKLRIDRRAKLAEKLK